MAYTKQNFTNGQTLNAENLNKMEECIYANSEAIDQLSEEKVTNPSTATVGQVLAVKTVDTNGKPTEYETIDQASGSSYTLPIASPTQLGGVQPVAKTDDMTQEVGIDELGMLFTAPSSGGNGEFVELLNKTISIDEAITSVEESLSSTDLYSIYIAYIDIGKSTLEDISCSGNVNVYINNALLGYWAFVPNLSSNMCSIRLLSILDDKFSIAYCASSTVNINNNKANITVDSHGTTQTKNYGKFKLVFPAQYTGNVTVKIYGK